MKKIKQQSLELIALEVAFLAMVIYGAFIFNLIKANL